MQSQSKFRTFLNNLTQKQKAVLVFGAAFLGVVFILGLVAQFGSTNRPKKGTSSIDSVSGEKVNVIPGQSENFGESSPRPYVLGLDTLTNLGLTTFQISEVNASLYDYGVKSNGKFRRASIDTKNLTVSSIGEPYSAQTTTIGAPFIIDDKTKAYIEIRYVGANDIQIRYLETKGGKVIYDGEKIDGPESIDQTVD